MSKAYFPNNLVPSCRNLLEAKTQLMLKYERFWMKNGYEHNMKIVIFIAQNRLTFYANGGMIIQRAEGEEEMKKMF